MSVKLLNLLYPRRCPVCDDIVIPKGGLVCDSCKDILIPLQEPLLQMRKTDCFSLS